MMQICTGCSSFFQGARRRPVGCSCGRCLRVGTKAGCFLHVHMPMIEFLHLFMYLVHTHSDIQTHRLPMFPPISRQLTISLNLRPFKSQSLTFPVHQFLIWLFCTPPNYQHTDAINTRWPSFHHQSGYS